MEFFGIRSAGRASILMESEGDTNERNEMDLQKKISMPRQGERHAG
jgi:hypothetical protein